jgi:hypothetical protein
MKEKFWLITTFRLNLITHHPLGRDSVVWSDYLQESIREQIAPAGDRHGPAWPTVAHRGQWHAQLE